MLLRKTEKAKWTIVYHEGRRIAEFVNKEFTTQDKDVILALSNMGYECIETAGKVSTKKAEVYTGTGPSIDDIFTGTTGKKKPGGPGPPIQRDIVPQPKAKPAKRV